MSKTYAMISLCITNLNRFEMLLQSFEKVVMDERITEIIISDDGSEIDVYNAIIDHVKQFPKIKVFRNHSVLGVYHNKYMSVKRATNEWCIVFDSDNILSTDYLDVLYNLPVWDEKTAYNPDFGKTEFDYRHLSGRLITKNNAGELLKQKRFDCLINAMNYFVNRIEFLKHFDDKVEPIAADSIYKNYLWLKAGNNIYVTPGLQYVHRVHKGSHYVNNCNRSNEFHAKVTNLIKGMK